MAKMKRTVVAVDLATWRRIVQVYQEYKRSGGKRGPEEFKAAALAQGAVLLLDQAEPGGGLID